MKKLILSLLLLVSLLFAKIETYTRDYTYYAGDEDSKNSSRAAALVQVKKLLLEEVGTYIESHSLVENNMLTKDEIIAICAGITKTEILKEDWNGKTYAMQAKIQLDPEDVQKSLNKIAQDQSKTNELKEQYAKVQAALAENEKLKKELETVKGEKQREKINAEYEANTKILSASEYAYESLSWRDNKKATQISLMYANKYVEKFEFVDPFDASKDFYLKDRIATQVTESFIDTGNYCYHKGDYHSAIKHYKKAIEINPKDAEAYFNIGNAYAFKGDYDSAFKHYQKAIEINPQDARPYNNIGIVYAHKGSYDTAIKNYEKAIEFNPQNAEAYFNMGKAYALKGDYDNADQCVTKAAKLGYADAQQFCKKHNLSW